MLADVAVNTLWEETNSVLWLSTANFFDSPFQSFALFILCFAIRATTADQDVKAAHTP
jgi:hypothetical protein